MHILGAYVHVCARYEVSVIKPVDRRTVHNDNDNDDNANDNTNDDTRWPIHDCIGSSAISK